MAQNPRQACLKDQNRSAYASYTPVTDVGRGTKIKQGGAFFNLLGLRHCRFATKPTTTERPTCKGTASQQWRTGIHGYELEQDIETSSGLTDIGT